jgi:2C-methyl-D-erythritol 2,4-cyclodiphosphate synthase
VATLQANTLIEKRTVTKGCPQGSCCGHGFWDIMYNALLNLKISGHTKIIAYADDLVIMTTGNNPSEAEVFANTDLAKIEKWANDNKMLFNDIKSKAMLISRKRNNGNINIYLNNIRLEVVKELKYLRNTSIIGSHLTDTLNIQLKTLRN